MVNATWQARMPCRKCAAQILVSLDAMESSEAGLAVFYCPACGERCQVEYPAGYDPRNVPATQAQE